MALYNVREDWEPHKGHLWPIVKKENDNRIGHMVYGKYSGIKWKSVTI